MEISGDKSSMVQVSVAGIAWDVEQPVLDRIRALDQIRREADHHAATLVKDARGQGITWELIGQALGVTRQAAQAKHGGRPWGGVTS